MTGAFGSKVTPVGISAKLEYDVLVKCLVPFDPDRNAFNFTLFQRSRTRNVESKSVLWGKAVNLNSTLGIAPLSSDAR